MGVLHDFKKSSRGAILVAIAAAAVGIIYGYDSSNIGGALDFISADFGITSEAEKGLLTSYVIFGEIVGAIVGGQLRLSCLRAGTAHLARWRWWPAATPSIRAW